MHNIQSVLLGKNPLRGVSPRLRKKRLGDLTTILTLDELVTPIPMGVAGPLPEGIVGLVLGRSSLSEKKKKKREKKNFGGARCSRF